MKALAIVRLMAPLISLLICFPRAVAGQLQSSATRAGAVSAATEGLPPLSAEEQQIIERENFTRSQYEQILQKKMAESGLTREELVALLIEQSNGPGIRERAKQIQKEVEQRLQETFPAPPGELQLIQQPDEPQVNGMVRFPQTSYVLFNTGNGVVLTENGLNLDKVGSTPEAPVEITSLSADPTTSDAYALVRAWPAESLNIDSDVRFTPPGPPSLVGFSVQNARLTSETVVSFSPSLGFHPIEVNVVGGEVLVYGFALEENNDGGSSERYYAGKISLEEPFSTSALIRLPIQSAAPAALIPEAGKIVFSVSEVSNGQKFPKLKILSLAGGEPELLWDTEATSQSYGRVLNILSVRPCPEGACLALLTRTTGFEQKSVFSVSLSETDAALRVELLYETDHKWEPNSIAWFDGRNLLFFGPARSGKANSMAMTPLGQPYLQLQDGLLMLPLPGNTIDIEHKKPVVPGDR